MYLFQMIFAPPVMLIDYETNKCLTQRKQQERQYFAAYMCKDSYHWWGPNTLGTVYTEVGKFSLPARTRVLVADTCSARSNLSAAKTVHRAAWWQSQGLNKKKKNWIYLFSYLHTARQHGVKDVSSLFHDSHILRGGVSALAVLDRVDEAVSELAQWAQQILFNETHHVVVWEERQNETG